MLAESHRIAIVVPTKDRPVDLRRMLASLSGQKRCPDQVIVVDGSEQPIEDVVRAFPRLSVEYVRCFPPSLARQRNAGMAKLQGDISLAGYLDDDVVLEADAIANMLEYWSAAGAQVGGAAFNITNNPRPGGLLLKEFFGIDARQPGKVMRSGFPSSIPRQAERIETDWLYGGATVWRREVIDSFPYDEWFIGTGFMEDIDYSFNVRSRFSLVLVADARLAHYSRPVRPDRQYLLGVWQVVNRMYFVRKYRSRGMSEGHAWWASIGLVVLNLAAAACRLSAQHLSRARGNIAGILSILLGRNEQIGGYLK